MTEQNIRLSARIPSIRSREDLASFVGALRKDLETNRDDWENPTLEDFLEAMEAWIGSMDRFYANKGQQVPQSPTWEMFAHILHASKIYE
jgi:hypothetical protein